MAPGALGRPAAVHRGRPRVGDVLLVELIKGDVDVVPRLLRLVRVPRPLGGDSGRGWNRGTGHIRCST